MSQSASAYLDRASECARLANLTQDPMIQRELLQLRQTYLRVAGTLGVSLPEALARTQHKAGKPQ